MDGCKDDGRRKGRLEGGCEEEWEGQEDSGRDGSTVREMGGL